MEPLAFFLFCYILDPNEAESPHALKATVPTPKPKLAGGYSPPMTPSDSSAFVFGNPVNPVRGRSVSIPIVEGTPGKDKPVTKEKLKPVRSDSQQNMKK